MSDDFDLLETNSAEKTEKVDVNWGKAVDTMKSKLAQEDDPQKRQKILNATLDDVVHMAEKDRTTLLDAIKDLTEISGQKPVITRAKKSIATFKVREGMALGLKVTLRKEKMYNFFSKLVNVALPRVRDFQGIKANGFDGRGNFTMGIKEHTIFHILSLTNGRLLLDAKAEIVGLLNRDSKGLVKFKFRKTR